MADELTITEWLKEMVQWTRGDVLAVLLDNDASLSKRIAARRLLAADDSTLTKAGASLAGPEFDKIVDRTEGKPKSAEEDRLGNQINILNITTDDLLGKINDYLRTSKPTLPFDLQSELEVPPDGTTDTEGSPRECPGESSDSEGGSGESDTTE